MLHARLSACSFICNDCSVSNCGSFQIIIFEHISVTHVLSIPGVKYI